MSSHHLRASLALTLVFGTACGDEEGPGAERVRIRAATSDECPTGGQTILFGTDEDDNGTLDDGEVQATAPVCNGAQGETGERGIPGTNALVLTTDEPAGGNCTNGGVRVDVGLDDDGDGSLAETEIDATTYVCNGVDGQDGTSSLIATDSNTTGCGDNGGIRVRTGLDDDGNGVLDEGEVDETREICSGDDGTAALIDVTREPAGANCPVGGLRIDTGADTNGNGVLETGEIENTDHLCDPIQSLVRISAEVAGTSTNCPAGGTRIEAGLDDDDDGELDPAEVDSVRFACSGQDGLQSLVISTAEPAGANCANGGRRVDVGLDADRSGTLEAAEVASTSYVCNGTDGADGTDGAPGTGGSAVRVSAEPPGSNCTNGGTRIESGPDSNGNGALDNNEVTSTSYACDGPALNSLVDVTPEPSGANCANGGQRIDSGVDSNANGTLDGSEIQNTAYVCNTLASVSFAITTSALPDARVNTAYPGSLTAAGGTGGSYSWSVVAGSLPPGLSLEPTGTPTSQITGAPTASGTFNFTVQVVDFFGQAATRAFSLVVDEGFRVTSLVLPRVVNGTSYNFNLSSRGGTAPVSYAVIAGSLPAGLSLASDGTISGTPTSGIGTRFLVRATDGDGATTDVALRIRGIEQFAAYVGDFRTGSLNEVGMVSLASFTPGMPTLVSPSTPPSSGDADTGTADVKFDPTGQFFGFIGDLTVDNQDELYIVDLRGGSVQAASSLSGSMPPNSGGDVESFQFSPDGRWVAFVQDRNTSAEDELFIVDLTGGANFGPVTKVGRTLPSSADVDDDEDLLAWSPDGRYLAYASEELTNDILELFLVDVQTSSTSSSRISPTNATTSNDLDPFGKVEWTADARTVLYSGGFNGTGDGLWATTVVNGTAGSPTFISDADDFEWGIAPNGRRVWFLNDPNVSGANQVFVRDLTENGPTGSNRLVSPAAQSSSEDVFRANWSPDSNRLVFVGDPVTSSKNELFIVDTNPNTPDQPTRLSQAGISDTDVFSGSDDFEFSPDGAVVFYTADERVNSQNEGWVVSIVNPGVATPIAGTIPSSADVNEIHVSPDGTLATYTVDSTNAGDDDLFVVTYTSTAAVGTPQQVNGALDYNNSSTSGIEDDAGEGPYFLGGNQAIIYLGDEVTPGGDAVSINTLSGGTVGTPAAASPTQAGSGNDIFEIRIVD